VKCRIGAGDTTREALAATEDEVYYLMSCNICIRPPTHVRACVCMCVKHTHIYIYICVYVYVYIYIHVCMYVYLSIYPSVYVCMYIYIYATRPERRSQRLRTRYIDADGHK